MSSSLRVPDLLRRRAAGDPEAVALAVDGAGSLTYGAWDRRSDDLAAGLLARGVATGDRVVLSFDPTDWIDYAVGYIGVHKAGAVAVPASPRFSADELAWVVQQTDPVLVVCAGPPPAVPAPTARVADLEADGVDQTPPTAAGSGDRLAEIIYTSGTTGTPKGVACTHAGLLDYELPGQAPDEPLSFAHAFPIGTNAAQACLHMTLRRPATAVVLPTFDPARLCALIEERRIARLQLVPAMAQMLVGEDAVDRHDLSSVEAVVLSSAPPPASLWDRLAEIFPQAALFNAYALTESGSARTLMAYDPDRPRAVGRPVGDTRVRVVDEAGDDLPAGRVGEIQLGRPGGPTRFYYRDPEATAAAFDGDWLRTGDLGYLDGDGVLHLVDRSKDVIITGGVNVSSVEVQDALHTHPAVVDAAVFGLPHTTLGEQVAGAVVLASPTSERELQATVRDRLGEHKVPRRIEVVDELPRNASGKIDKRELADRLAAPPASREPAGPRNDIEATVLAVWQQVLDRDDIGVHDDFFTLDGHSLGAAQIVARLEDELGTQLPVTLVFEHPTVAEVAETIADTRAPAG